MQPLRSAEAVDRFSAEPTDGEVAELLAAVNEDRWIVPASQKPMVRAVMSHLRAYLRADRR